MQPNDPRLAPPGQPAPGTPGAWLAQAQSGVAAAARPTRPDPSAAKLHELGYYERAALDAPPVARCTEPRDAGVHLTLEADVLDVLRRCATVHLEDKRAERNKRLLMGVGIVMGVASFVALFVHQVLVALTGVALTVAVFLWRSYVAEKDVEDRKLDVVSGLLARLGSELDLTRPVKVDVDFHGYQKQAPQTAFGVPATLFEHTWLTLTFVLADETRVAVSATQHVKRRSRRKPKYTKIKDRSQERLDVRLVAPKGKSFRPAQLQGRAVGRLFARRAVVQPRYAEFQYVTAETMRLRDRGGWSAAGLEHELDGQAVFAAVVASYRLAAQAERGSA
jgi:hypothetical protein